MQKKPLKGLFDQSQTTSILARIELLRPDSHALWGKMNVGQMLAHCSASLETAMGLNEPKKLPMPLRLIGAVMKSGFLSDKPMPRNSATDKSYLVADARDFELEKAKVMQRINAFYTGGATKCTRRKHVFFGTMQPAEWAFMQWKHFDHHLRQFGV